MKPSNPAISAVLCCTDNYPTIAATLGCLRAQTICDCIELVIVASSEPEVALPADALQGFWGHQIVSIGFIDSIARANAAGIRRARAPIVALCEDHCFPEPEWAAALVQAHTGPWAAVGPVIRNANPESAVSWADYLIGYGPWADPAPSGEVSFLPGHNSSYKRTALLAYGERLEGLLESETVLHLDMHSRGERLYLCAEARAAHVNFSKADSWLKVQIHNGRVFAATRAKDWSRARRWFYTAASPLIPPLRCWRAAKALMLPGRPRRELFRTLPMLAVGLILDGIGQMLGYCKGAGRSAEVLAKYEFRRIDHVLIADRVLFSTGKI
ncbi:MAG: glycosyltransferase family 2 protein [Gammaproteobacteria bacterium]